MSLQAKVWKTAAPMLAAAAIGLAAAPVVVAQDVTTMMPDAVQWGDVPNFLPPGAQVAVLSGDPSKEGLFMLRLKMPDGYEIPAHTHSQAENVTVLSGSFNFAHGDAPTRDSAEVLPAGGYVSIPAGHPHLAFATGETVVELAGEGPFDITYLNPSDDPRNN